jgi:membrane fusion protein, multidrug efflux system
MSDASHPPAQTESRPPAYDAAHAAAPPHDDAPPPTSASVGRVVAGAVVLVAITASVVWFLATRRSSALAAEARARTTASSEGAVVRTTLVSQSSPVRVVDLLGEARPYASVTLYAKVAGYLKTVGADVGDRVGAGAVIATIESPETDRALSAAKADYENKQLIAGRVTQLLARKMVSPQEADQAKTEAAVANEKLEGLKEQQAYESLRAPFAGKVTARFADPGALVQSAANSQTSALPVVTISQTDRLRVFVYLDQSDAAIVRPGSRATIALPDRPDARISVTVSRLAGELDPKTRKMLAELDVDNANGAIVPGSFVQVQLDFASAQQPQAPVEALLVRGGKTFVATVDDQSTVHLVPVTVASNDGRAITFSSGVATGQRVALNLGSAVADGARVQVEAAPAAAAK